MNKIAEQSQDILQDLIQKMRELYPSLFNDEKNLNEEELKNLMTNFASKTEGKYEFNWAGKMNAKKNAFTPSRAMLKPDKKRSIDFDKTENLIIEGDNLDVLKQLQKAYSNSIKCIYIDPPYNTGRDFIYSDNYSIDKKAYWEMDGTTENGVKIDSNTESQGRYHSNWLNMIYPRLLQARNLLREDGVIFVSIDDNEVHNLRKVLDDIFGEENFVSDIIWHSKYTTSNDAKNVSRQHEHILFYAKQIEVFDIGLLDRTKEMDNAYKNPDNDPKGRWKATPLHAKSGTEAGIYTMEFPNGKTWTPPKGRFPRYSKSRLLEIYNEGGISFNSSGGIDKKTYLTEVKQGKTVGSIWSFNDVGSSHQANEQLAELFDKGMFDNPKPVQLIQQIVKISNDKNGIYLDFFGGSGTTAQAIMELNKNDGGNRKYILIQIPEQTEVNSEAHKAGYKTISQICIARVKKVSEKLSKEGVKEVDLGFKVFALSQSFFPENQFSAEPDKTDEENQVSFDQYLQNVGKQLGFTFDETELMYEVLLKDGFTLNFKAEKVQEFTKNVIYKVTDGEKTAFLCLDGTLHEDSLQKLQGFTDHRFLCLERAVDTTKKWNLKNMFGDNLWVI